MNAFSFCIFGSSGIVNNRVENDKDLVDDGTSIIAGGYYDGLDENLQLIEKYFPGWRVYVYMGADVPIWFEEYISNKYSCVAIRRTGVLGHENTVHRFFAIDEPDVNFVFFRDADSRVHWKDRWAIQNFLSQTVYRAHIIRDHPEHNNAIAAGTWGVQKGLIKQSVRDLYAKWTPVHLGNGDASDVYGFGIDQNFLEAVIYPMLASSILVTHSNGHVRGDEVAIEFPFEWSNDMYVGRREGKPITENFWLRELDTPPPQIRAVVMPVREPPSAVIPPVEKRKLLPFLRYPTADNA